VNPKTIVTSPSFTLVNEYQGRAALYHMDVYRLGSLDEALSAGIEETIHTGGWSSWSGRTGGRNSS